MQGVRGVGGSVQAIYRRGRRGGALRTGHRAAICTPRLARGRAQHSPSPPRRARARRRSLRASPLRSVWSRRSLRPTAATARGWHSGCASCSRLSRASSSSPSARRWPCSRPCCAALRAALQPESALVCPVRPSSFLSAFWPG